MIETIVISLLFLTSLIFWLKKFYDAFIKKTNDCSGCAFNQKEISDN